jgi:hypothetical protein
MIIAIVHILLRLDLPRSPTGIESKYFSIRNSRDPFVKKCVSYFSRNIMLLSLRHSMQPAVMQGLLRQQWP